MGSQRIRRRVNWLPTLLEYKRDLLVLIEDLMLAGETAPGQECLGLGRRQSRHYLVESCLINRAWQYREPTSGRRVPSHATRDEYKQPMPRVGGGCQIGSWPPSSERRKAFLSIGAPRCSSLCRISIAPRRAFRTISRPRQTMSGGIRSTS